MLRILPLLLRMAFSLVLLTLIMSSAATAQIVVSANDGKLGLVEGATTTLATPTPDTVTIIDVGAVPPKVIAEIRAPASVIGPPQSVAIAPDESMALVTSSTKVDPADPKKTVPDDRVTVIDLRASPPAVLTTVRAGNGASGVSINRAGTLALVANRSEGTISVFTIAGKTVTAAGKVDLGAPESGPSHVVFTADGRTALVTRNNDSLISLLSVDGSHVEYAKRDLAGGLRPYGIDVAGTLAYAANIGAGASGGSDTVSIIDLAARPPRVVNQVAVGPVPEGIAASPDGRFVAVTVMNGSNAPKASPFFNEFGLLRIFAVKNQTLTPIADAKIGAWCQGAAWSRDGRTVLAQCMLEREILVFRFDGQRLTPGPPIKLSAGPAGIRTAER